MYCTVKDVFDIIKEDMWNGIIGDEYIEDEQERKEKITALCDAAIEDASAEIDGYLSKRYSIPFQKTPKVIKKFAKDMAAYILASRCGIDENGRDKIFLTKYNDAVKFLLNVAKGLIDIGIEDEPKKAENGFNMRSSKRTFSRDSMKGW